ncbi:MAG TPA: ShlB/FhaC/HecB family hemolysin secretion/activation protein [Desulfuromonadales bacterium]|nr:ShlB/FhaC/HecB family hemolysin secretion/activation protein [Desulfuromonadales bacterium]
MYTTLTRALLAVAALSTAAVAADIPDSGRLLRENTPPSVRPHKELPRIQKPVEQKELASSGVRVKVESFVFGGNTIFTSNELNVLMSKYIGKELTLVELNAAAATITAAYREKGYFLAQTIIPPQTIKTGTAITIQIIEGILDGVRLETKPQEIRTSKSLFQSYISRIPTGKPAEEGAITDMMMRINELPGVSSKILLEPGSSPGTTQGVLEVTEGKPYSLSIDTDNHGNYSTGYYRVGSSLELYSPLHRGDLFTLRAQTSFSGNSQSVQTGYIVPVSSSGTKVGLNYSFVTYQLGESFKSLDASGDAHNVSLYITQPVIRSRKLMLNLSASGEGKFLDDRVKIANSRNLRHIASGQLGINGVEIDAFMGGGSTSFSLNYSGGFNGIDDNATKTVDQSATGLHTDGGFNKLYMNIARNQNIYKNLTLYTGLTGQWAGNNLDSAEQFSLGGPSAVRAFPTSEASCDMGFIYTAEMRYLVDSLGKIPVSLQLSAFVDHGYAVLHDDPIAPDNTSNLTGAGFGLSWFDAESFIIRSSIAWRTTGTATGKSEMTQPTVYFQAVKKF